MYDRWPKAMLIKDTPQDINIEVHTLCNNGTIGNRCVAGRRARQETLTASTKKKLFEVKKHQKYPFLTIDPLR